MTSRFDNARQAEVKTRQERRQARVIARAERAQKQNAEQVLEQSQETESIEKGRPKIRLIPIWLRLIIVAVLLVISMTAGLMFGYGVIGDGKAIDALKISTWERLVDLVVKDTPDNK
ncbi:MAG TPA: DNA-directed RNA polymerase subunit beta [Bacillus bacterium]|nr:DNA-directed RNA polymerase subunit beta [Bacillus sp. (in: firmicutes)]